MENLGEAIDIKIIEFYSSQFLCTYIPTHHGVPDLTLIRVTTEKTQKFCCIVRNVIIKYRGNSSLWLI